MYNDNLPLGAENDSSAPYNYTDSSNSTVNIKADAYLTLYKKIQDVVDTDVEYEDDEDGIGNYIIKDLKYECLEKDITVDMKNLYKQTYKLATELKEKYPNDNLVAKLFLSIEEITNWSVLETSIYNAEEV